MTSQDVTPVRLSGLVADRAVKQTTNGNDYIEIKLQQEGKQYPLTIRDFKNLLAEVKKGQQLTLDVTETQGTGSQGRPVTYRNAFRLVTEEQAAPTLQQPARAPTMPAAAPAYPAGGGDTQRASIEAQVAAKIASEILRDMLATVDGTPESKMPIVRTLLPELTMIARAAIHEASQT